ncbi:hypothetical protein SAMN05192573_103402 [Mucilaginibacter gossypii]|uniref:Uncharacterized protein n=1 Tax=Mucilaginibacter gossypii TaxID=551996 RepID=A0A1G7U859_9SPHI|nr:hypothetical protein SAMN05192573_103402 [Mucilaginibacter gossypii]
MRLVKFVRVSLPKGAAPITGYKAALESKAIFFIRSFIRDNTINDETKSRYYHKSNLFFSFILQENIFMIP